MTDGEPSSPSTSPKDEIKRRNDRKAMFQAEAIAFRLELASQYKVPIEQIVFYEDRLNDAVDEYFVAVSQIQSPFRNKLRLSILR